MVWALQEDGLAKAWEEMTTLTAWRRDHGHFDGRRAAQAQYWFEQEVRQALLAQLETADARAEMQKLAEKVAGGELVPSLAAQEMLNRLKS